MGMVINQKVKREDLDLGIEMEKGEDVVMVVEKGEEKEEDEARVSICIPPRNALLLMRCRSDPVRMAALTSRFWDSPAMKVRVEEGREEEEEGDDGNVNMDRCAESNNSVAVEERSKQAAETKQLYEEETAVEESLDVSVLTEELSTSSDGLERKKEVVLLIPGEDMQNEDENLKGGASAPVDENANAGDEQEVEETAAAEADNAHSGEKPEEKEMTDEVDPQDREDDKEVDKGTRSSSCASTVDKQERTHRCISRSKEGGRRRSLSSRERDRRHSFSTEREARRPSFGSEKEVRRASFSMEGKGRWSFSIEKDGLRLEKEATDEQNRSKEQCLTEEKEPKDIIEAQNSQSTEKGGGTEEDDYNTEHRQLEREAAQKRAEEKKSTELPDCLLLMMYEPKLSMEVSKETWVCSTDFLQWHLHHPNRPRHPPKSIAAATITTTTDTSIDGTSLDEVATDEASEITNDMSSENKEVVAPIQEPSQPSPPTPLVPPTASETEKKIKSNAPVLPTPVSASAYEPFMLTRCKSEPMRSSVRLTPDAFFWKDRHRPIGATRIGF